MAQQKAVDPAVEEVDDLIDELQPGAKLLKGQYTITRYLNSGGFGITYLAKDSLDRDVVIKECFPSSVCRRSKVVVAARSRAHTAELRSIVQLFVKEARNLAKIVHPNIVAVHQVFEDNGTAYMAIDYIDGLDLQQVIDGEGPRLTPDHIVVITEKLLKAVGFIHSSDMLHRDISPDNVLIDKSGEPILIDFGAARDQASKTNRAMSALRVVKDGYSPQEFYIAGSEQGPWSDLYALAATLYHLISDEAPVNGQARLSALAEDRPDPYVPLTGRFTGYPRGYLEAIDRAMSTLPKQRLQTAAEWLAMFRGGPVGLAAPAGVDDAVHKLVSDFNRTGAADTAAAPETAASAPSVSAEPELPVAAAASGGKSKVQLAAGVAVALVVATAGYFMLGGDPAPVATGDAVASVAEESGESAGIATEPSEATETAVAAADDTTAVADGEAALSEPAPEASTAEGAETSLAAAKEPESSFPEVARAPDESAEEPAPADAPATTAEAAADTAAEAASEPVAEPVPDTATAPEAEPAEVLAAEPAAEPSEDLAAEAVSEPVAEVAAETAPEPAVEPAAETTGESVAEPAAETEVATAEASATQPAAEEAPPPAPTFIPAKNQVAFAAWDIEMPFVSDDRIIGGDQVAVVTSIPPTVNLDEAGSWLAPGLLIYSVNGAPTPTSDVVVMAIMNALRVDPDGKARVIVEYAGSSLERQTDLMTVAAIRLVGLANGVSLRTAVVDGAWKTEVTGVTQPELTTLRQGDVLFRDKTSGTPLDGPDTLEKIVAELAGLGVTETRFSIIRDNKVAEASMQLAAEGGQ
jgi:predicted Ser/Thr protein kinase